MSMKDLVDPLIERRANLVHEMRNILEERADENGVLPGEDEQTYQRMNEQVSSLGARIDELVGLHQVNARADEARAAVEAVVRPDVVAEAENSQENALRDFIAGKRKHVDISFRGLQGVKVDPQHFGWKVNETRDLLKVTGAAGGDTVPTSFVRSLYEHLIENSAIRQTNVNVVTTTSGENLEFPKTLTHGTAVTIVGEGSAGLEGDPTFDKVTLGAWKYFGVLQHSSELAQDTGVDLLGYIARDFGRQLGNQSGADFITGNGTNKPRGVIAATLADVGTAVQGTVASTIEADDLIDLQYSVIEPYARNGFWLMRRATEGAIRKLKGSDNNYLWQPGLQAGSPNLLLGRPVVTDPNVAAVGSANASVAFGDFSAYTIRDVAGVRIERSDDFAFTSDMATWRAILRTDGDLIDSTGAIKVMDTD